MGLKPGTFKVHPERLAYDAELSFGAKAVLLVILQSINANNVCYISQKRISEILKTPRRTVQFYLRELREHGYIESHQRGRTTPETIVYFEAQSIAPQGESYGAQTITPQETVSGRRRLRLEESRGAKNIHPGAQKTYKNEAPHNIEERNIYNEIQIEKEIKELKWRKEFIKNMDKNKRENYLKNREKNTPTMTKQARETDEWREMYGA